MTPSVIPSQALCQYDPSHEGTDAVHVVTEVTEGTPLSLSIVNSISYLSTFRHTFRHRPGDGSDGRVGELAAALGATLVGVEVHGNA